MKFILVLLLSALVAGHPLWAGPLDAPILEGQVLFTWDADADGTDDLEYRIYAPRAAQGFFIYNSVEAVIRTTESVRLVQPEGGRFSFEIGEEVGSSALVYSNGNGGSPVSANWMPLLSYDEWQKNEGGLWRFRDNTPLIESPALTFYTNRTDLLIGFRHQGELSTNYGWLRLTRAAALFTNVFTVAGFDWNPVSGAPIRAGQPPAFPVVPTLTADGQLHLAWPESLAGWVLETSEQLGPYAEWQPVPDVFTHEVLLALPENNRFYRLRQP